MKMFTDADVVNHGGLSRISCDKSDLVERPLWWHDRGLSETASGYGRKLTTSKMIHFNGRLRRVYCCQISNAGTCYIVRGGAWLVVDTW